VWDVCHRKNMADFWCFQILSCGRASSYRIFTTSHYASLLQRIRKVYISRRLEEANRLTFTDTLVGLRNRNASLYNNVWTSLWLFWITETRRQQMVHCVTYRWYTAFRKAIFTFKMSRGLTVHAFL
jgi:hypothetical protein